MSSSNFKVTLAEKINKLQAEIQNIQVPLVGIVSYFFIVCTEKKSFLLFTFTLNNPQQVNSSSGGSQWTMYSINCIICLQIKLTIYLTHISELSKKAIS